MPFVPMTLGIAGGGLAMLLAAWGRRSESVACSIAGLSLGALAAGWLAIGEPWTGRVGTGPVFSPAVVACLVFGAVALAASFRTLAATTAGPRVAVLAAFGASAAALLAAALDLGVLFLSVETLALSGYGLVALAGTDRAREAAMKWFVQGSVATAFLIVGIGVLISRTGGSLSYDALRQAASAPASSAPMAVGLVLVLSALAFKAGAFPFHSWMPDAFETAPPVATAVLASAGKVGPIVAAVWLAFTVLGATAARVLAVVAAVSVASIVFGNLAALRQRSLSRMLAYSGVAQVGYALAGVPLLSGAGGGAVLVFAMLYGLTSLASFVFIVAVREVEPGWDGSIPGLAGLSGRRPALAASLAVIMLSLTGIPLTAGFWGKFLVFGAAATGGYLWLALAGVLGSVVSFGYYGGVLRAAFMDDSKKEAPTDASAGAARTAETSGAVPPAPAERPVPVGTPSNGRGFATVATVALAMAIVLAGVLPLVTGLGMFAQVR